jgi:protoporphyrinogen oxidase
LKICILGAGITGLTIARLLDADGHEVTILERSRQPGGLCRSSVIEGFTCDHAGGHILFSKDKKTLEWMLDQVGRDNLVRKDRHTRIRWHDRYVPYPFENGLGHLPPEAKFDCLKGYLESVDRRKSGDPCPSNFHDWILWKMGQGFADHFMFPYNEKLWECDLHEMSSEWVAGRVPDAPIDDILKAAVGIDTAGYTHQAIFYFPLEGGFQALTDGVARAIPHCLRLGTAVESVRKTSEGWRVNDEDHDFVVNTIPLPELAPSFEGMPVDLAAEVLALRPVSLVNVLVGMKANQELEDLSWIYLPFSEQGPANRVTFFSNYSPRNAPPGHVSYMAEVTYRDDIDVTQAWTNELLQGLEHVGLVNRSDVVVTHAFKSRYAYIDQNREFPARIERIRKWFDASGMLTVGRFGRYEYHNSDQCIMRAFEATAQIREIAATGVATPFAFR